MLDAVERSQNPLLFLFVAMQQKPVPDDQIVL